MKPDESNYELGKDLPYQSSFIKALDTRQFSSAHVTDLYRDAQLTMDEFMVLDFIGINGIVKEGTLTVSFQGLKRIIELHQAKLTKAVNRLINKDLLIKEKFGYTLSSQGFELYKQLYQRYRDKKSNVRDNSFINVAHGHVQGPVLNSRDFELLNDAFIGKWFGKYRYTSKITYNESFEIYWLSTNGSISAALKIGPKNNLQLTLHAPIKSMAQSEIQLLIDHISHILEMTLDAPVVFNEFSFYENNNSEKKSFDEYKIHFAG